MGMYYIQTEIKFDYAHRLQLNYGSPCSSLHGHTGKIVVKIGSSTLDKNGMIVDFSHIKKPLKEWVDKNIDHAFIVLADDELSYALKTQKIYILPTYTPNTTAEVMAEHIFQIVKRIFEMHNFNFDSLEVIFYETENNCATYTED